MWRVLGEINELLKEEPEREQINMAEQERIKRKRLEKETYRRMIYDFLRKYKKPISLLSTEDIAMMTEGFDTIHKSAFLDQVKYCLETNYGKPLSWIRENNKSILFTKR